MTHVSPSFSATLRVRLDDTPGSFARLAEAIGDAGGLLGSIDIVRVEPRHKVRDVTVSASDDEHLHQREARSATRQPLREGLRRRVEQEITHHHPQPARPQRRRPPERGD